MSAPLYRFIALTHTYRRLFTVFLSLPALVLIFPVACGLVCALFGLCPVSQASIWISAAVRLASGMAMLEVLVMARFVGPTSIMRLSTTPLGSNFSPLQQTLQNPLSLLVYSDDAILRDAPLCRRFRRLSWHSLLQHIVLSMAFGFLTAYVTGCPLLSFNKRNLFPRAFVIILTILGNMAPVFWEGTSHEIDPMQYFYETQSIWSSKSLHSILKQSVMLALMTPLPSILLATSSISTLSSHFFRGNDRLFLELVFVSLLTTAFITVVDETIRIKLFHPRPNIQRFINELDDVPTATTRLGVLFGSLFGDASLVHNVLCPAPLRGIDNPETEEVNRMKELSQQMANHYFCPIDPQIEAPLEEDVLRILLLESMGGLGSNDSISEWTIDHPFALGTQQRRLSTVLVRGLTVFIASWGDVLARCVAASGGHNRWEMAPATVACWRFAITAIQRSLTHSMSPIGDPMSDWNSAHLTTLIPSALVALFHLRSGVFSFSKIPSPKTMEHAFDARTIERMCDDAATAILLLSKRLKCLSRFDRCLDRDCLQWKNTLTD